MVEGLYTLAEWQKDVNCMIRGLYTSGMGMERETKRLDVIANNLANASTNGFKTSGTTNGTFSKLLEDVQVGRTKVDIANYSPDVVSTYTNFSQGSLMSTGSDKDIAIVNDDNAFFEVENAEGEKLYTRNGAFLINKEGYLVTSENYKVMGQNGPIKFDGATTIGVSYIGEITDTSGNVIDKLSIKAFENPQTLLNEGGTYWTAGEKTLEKEFLGEVQQNYLEASNVNTVEEMVNMIEVTRAYEANQKVLHANDELLSQSNSIGKIG